MLDFSSGLNTHEECLLYYLNNPTSLELSTKQLRDFIDQQQLLPDPE